MSESLKKINVVGTSGSGKSLFANRLANVLSFDYIEMDALFWKKNWQSSSEEEFLHRLKEAINKDSWVLDGNYTRTVPIKWKDIDTVIWLDFGFTRTFLQSARRAVTRAYTKKELWPGTGNTESFRMLLFSSDSILLWMLKTYWKNRRKYENMMHDKRYSHISFIRLRSPEACAAFLAEFE